MKGTISAYLGAALAAALLGVAPARAHEGHDHGAPPPPVSLTIAPRADASSAEFELVAIVRGDRLRIYLDTFRGNEPVVGATIEIDGPDGTVAASPTNDGAYTLEAPWLSRPGNHDLAITVQSGDTLDILAATLTIPEPNAVPSRAVGAGVGLDTVRALVERAVGYGGGVWAGIAGGFVLGVLTTLLTRRRRPSASAGAILALALLAAASPSVADTRAAPPATERDVAQRFADGAVFVPKTTQRILALRTLFTQVGAFPGTVELPARVIPDPNATGYVQASVAGRLLPPPGGFPRVGARVAAGDVLAFVQAALPAADATSQQQQARELDQQIALVERRLERFRQIQAVIARAQIEDAELELQGLRTRRANLDRAPRQAERLTAPVSGVVAAEQAIAGRIAEPNTIIFQIVDPDRFWVEALSFEPHAIGQTATGRFGDGRSVTLAYRGSGLADRNQAIPIQFNVEDRSRTLRAGQLLTVLAETQDRRTGIAVPRKSVLRGVNGQSIVFEHTNAERFLPREVRVEPLDAERVLIVEGVEAGRRIVTQGAELLNQIR